MREATIRRCRGFCSVSLMLCILLSFSLSTPAVGGEADERAAVGERVDIRISPHAFQTTIPGNVDESRFLWPNLPGETSFFSSVRIKNEGMHDIVNPRLSINGFRMPLTTRELMGDLTQNASDAVDRILRVFYALTRYASSMDMPAGVPVYPLGFFLNYGYGYCFNKVLVQAQLWEVMKYPWRSAKPMNHSTAEVKNPKNGRAILLDPEFIAFYLRHDNRTIASANDIREDPMLVLRSTHERNYNRSPWQEGDPLTDMWGSSEKMAALYGTAADDPWDASARGPHLNEHYSIRLRPGESYGWHSDRARYHGSLREHEATRRISRQLVWETDLDLSKPHHRWFLMKKGDRNTDAAGHATLDERQSWEIPYHLLFPLLGMSMKIDPVSGNPGQSDSPLLNIALKTAAKTVDADVPLSKLTGHFYSLDALLQKLPYPLKEVKVLVSLKSPGSREGKSIQIKGLQIRWFCQSTTYACPSLRAGENRLVYTDESKERDVRIDIEAKPAASGLPHLAEGDFSPAGAREVAENALRFVWPAASGKASVAGYQWQLSAYLDMRYPLSPTFERLVNGAFLRREDGKEIFELPWRGMLPVGQELYWRVRPYDQNNLAGNWSPVQAFKVRGPGVPQNVRLTVAKGRQILQWDRNREGTAPVRYEIHTSPLEGFMPTDKQHRILGMSASDTMKHQWEDVYASDWPTVPPTLLASTARREWTVLEENSPPEEAKRPLGAHYRIIAVDAEGSRSCPSPQIHLPHPQIVAPKTVKVPPGNVRWQVPVISSLGRVLAKVPDYRLGLWDKSTVVFSLPNTPQKNHHGWRIDRSTGVIHGRLAKGETVRLTVEALDTRYGIRHAREIVFASDNASIPRKSDRNGR